MTATSPVQGFPLSPQQRVLWRARRGETATPGVARAVATLDRPLDAALFLAAASHASARHEILRTVFRRPPGVQLPLQVIDPAVGIAARVMPSAEGTLERDLADDAAAPLDLEAGPLVRATLFQLGPTRCVVSVRGSALVLDEPSALLLLHELCGVSPISSDEAPVQYADVAAWQDEALADRGPEAETARAHWQSLANLRGSVLPNQQGDASITRRRARVKVVLRDESHDLASRLAERLSVDVADVVLAAWLAYLARVNAQDEAITTLATDGRSYAELRDAIGPLGKTLPLRLSFDGDPTFGSVVRRVRAVTDEARAAQDQWVDGVDGSDASIVSAVMILDRGAIRDGEAPALASVELGRSDDAVQVRLVVREHGARVALELDHDLGAIDPDAGADVAASFAAFVDGVLAAPDRGIRNAALVSDAQCARIAAMLDRSGAALSRPPARITDAVADWALRTPEAPAVAAGDDVLTYAELQRRAMSVAAALVAQGVRPGDVVAVCVDRSVDAPVSMLGSLLSGAAFLPIDPGYPTERIAFMLRDARVRALVASGDAAQALPEHSLPTLDPSRVPADATTALRQGDDAYIIYTSGTTGTPRGVTVRQASLAHYAVAIGDVLGVGPDDVYLHTASLGFSSTIRQLLMPLARGASVVIASEDDRRDPLTLFALVRARGVTIIDLVPSYLRAVTRVLRAASASARAELLDNRLRLIASASEALHTDLPAAWRDLGFRGRIINMYGLSETTGIVATFELIDRDGAADSVRVVPIGRPLPGLRMLVVDEQHGVVPVGAVGELLVGGPSIGNEFLNDPARTAERFVANPLPHDATRMFCTGDRVRVAMDGNVEYVGRSDDVVKIRGVRIALGEVEVALARHPSVREAAAAAHGAPAASLVGYVAVRHGHAFDERELRQFVAGLLPSHMVPTTMVTVDALPLTGNGKLDRKALPAPDEIRERRGAAHVAPRDVLEDALSGIWAEILGVEQVGAEDDFFDLGGHSLLATQLVARVRETFRSGITLRSLFESRTVAEQARALRSQATADAPLDTIAAIVVRTRDLTPDAAQALLAQRNG